MFPDFLVLAFVKACAWVDSLRGVGLRLDSDDGTGVKEDASGSKFDNTVCFCLAGEVVSGIRVYRETVCPQ